MVKIEVFLVVISVCACAGSGFEQEVQAGHPVSKVVSLMKEMLKELEKEGEEDQDTFDQMSCWCETNEKAKTTAIADGEARVSDLTSTIEQLTAASSRLNAEVKDLTREVAKNDEALDSATELRTKQLAEFNAEEKDMMASISSMGGAVAALSKHHESFLQRSSTLRRMGAGVSSHRSGTGTRVFGMLRLQLHKHQELVNAMISPHQQGLLNNYLDADQPAMMLQAGQKQPQSGQIFGILKGMKESFERNLDQSQKEETENNNAYEDLKAAKTSEIAAGQGLIETKTQELASADVKNADSKQNLDDTEDVLESDSQFLANLQEKCKSLDAEFAERVKSRQQEVEGVNTALSFLTSDEAHDLFSRTLNPSFIQKQAVQLKRATLSSAISLISKHTRDPRLVELQVQVRKSVMDMVVSKVETVIASLVKEQKEEAALRDFCIEGLHKNQLATEENTRDKSDLNAKIDGMTNDIATLTKQITDELEAGIANAKVELKRAGENREKENKDFQITVADQRATQKLLLGALRALKGVYGASLLQEGRQEGAQPAFKPQEKNKKSGGVMGMIKSVITDAQQLEAEAIRGEEEAQKAYEEFTKNTNDSIDAMTKDLTNKREVNAKAKTDKVEHETERDDVQGTLNDLEKAKTDLKGRCDFTMKNFDVRQSSREKEIDALKEAMLIFRAKSFIQFLQKA